MGREKRLPSTIRLRIFVYGRVLYGHEKQLGIDENRRLFALRAMATSGRMLTGSVLHFHGCDEQFTRCFVATDWCRAKSEQTPQQIGANVCRLSSIGDVANSSLNFNALKSPVKPCFYPRKWRCLVDHAMDDSPADDMQDAQVAVAQLLHESGVSKEDAMAISSKAPVYTRELVDAVNELDDAHLWSSWQGESGGSGIEHDTFKNKIFQIARRRRDMGIFPFLESIGVNPLSTRHISRYLSAEPLICIIQKIDFFKELFAPDNFEGRNISCMVRRMMMQLSVSADDDLQQSLSFFEKMEARRGGLTILDSGDGLLARLIESFPKILLQSVDKNLKPTVEFLEATGVPKGYVGMVLLCFPPAILYGIGADIQPRIRTLEKAGICSNDVGKMILRYPWVLSKCIGDNVDDITAYFAAAKVPKKNVVRGITRSPQLLGYSPDRLKLMLNQINGLGIQGKTLARITSFSPQLLLRRPQDFIKVVSFMEELGLNTKSMGRILDRSPEIYASNVEFTLKRKVKFLMELGIHDLRLQRVVQKYPEFLVMDVDRTLRPRMEYLEHLGFSKANVAFMVSGFPPLLGYSVEKVFRPKLEYLVNDMGKSIKEAVTYPRYFSYSLEKKIKPRFRILQNRKIQFDLKTMLSKGDDEFAEEFLGVGRMLVPPTNDL